MKQIALLFVFFGLLAGTLFSQSYKDYNHFKKEKIFSDHFNDNKNNWRKYYSKIKKGRYVVETIAKDPATSTSIPVTIDTNRNYEIETEVSIEWNRTKEYMGVLWNAVVGNGYYLAFNKELISQVIKIEDNKQLPLSRAENLGILLPQYKKNLITIRRVGKEYLIYINKQLVYTFSYEGFYGNNIGYFVGKGSELRAYSLVISYLD